MSLNEYDFQNVCRTCLSTSNLKPLYQKNVSQNCLYEMLMICTAMEFRETDGLPLQICYACISELNRSYKFALKCRETDTQLRIYLQNQTADENVTAHTSNIICGQNYESNNSIEDPLEISEIKTELDDDITVIKHEIEPETDSFEHLPQFTDELEHYESNDDENPDISGMPILQDSNQSQEVYQCNNCRKCFYSYFMLNEHQQWPCEASVDETIERPYSCTLCDRKFIQKISLTKHIRTHTGEKPFACQICQKSFNVKANLTIHYRTHTGERPYSCEYCAATFRQPQHLKGHVNSQHQKTKAERASRAASKVIYLCTECNTTYTRKYQLKLHMREHEKEKFAYLCSICNMSFKDESSLTFHMYTHTGEKPYSCTMCDRSFNLQSNLTCHMRIHSY